VGFFFFSFFRSVHVIALSPIYIYTFNSPSSMYYDNMAGILTKYATNGKHSKNNHKYRWMQLQNTPECGSKMRNPPQKLAKNDLMISKLCEPILLNTFHYNFIFGCTVVGIALIDKCFLINLRVFQWLRNFKITEKYFSLGLIFFLFLIWDIILSVNATMATPLGG
jgi:hypothetical protein